MVAMAPGAATVPWRAAGAPPARWLPRGAGQGQLPAPAACGARGWPGAGQVCGPGAAVLAAAAALLRACGRRGRGLRPPLSARGARQATAEEGPQALAGQRLGRRRPFRPQDLLIPIVSVAPGPRPDPSELRSPVAPSSDRNRFQTLPPPSDARLQAKAGSGQLALASRLPDAARDVRIQSGTRVPAPADMPAHEIQSGVNLIPEPFCRAQRPDQRVTAVGVRPNGVKPTIQSSLESHGMLFERKQPPPPVDAMDEEELRVRNKSCNSPVTGTGREMRDRLERHPLYRRISDWPPMALFRECALLGIVSDDFFTATMMRKAITTRLKDCPESRFEKLSLPKLMFECSFRGLRNDGTREELLERLFPKRQGA